MSAQRLSCPLCEHFTANIYWSGREKSYGSWRRCTYWQCGQCELVFLDPSERLDIETEKQRYESHDNTWENYQSYLNPLLSLVLPRLHLTDHSTDLVLDYGCGKNPILANHLMNLGYNVKVWDPLFHNDTQVFNAKYQAIFSTEVIEHFYTPIKEFASWQSMLNPGGLIAVLTQFYSAKDFATWSYRKDPTHVIFFNDTSLTWLAQRFGWEIIHLQDPVAVFLKP